MKEIHLDSPVSSLSFFPDGVSVIAGTSTGLMQIYDLRNAGHPLLSHQAYNNEAITDIQFQRGSNKSNSIIKGITSSSSTRSSTNMENPQSSTKKSTHTSTINNTNNTHNTPKSVSNVSSIQEHKV